jgi:hypothetical protein
MQSVVWSRFWTSRRTQWQRSGHASTSLAPWWPGTNRRESKRRNYCKWCKLVFVKKRDENQWCKFHWHLFAPDSCPSRIGVTLSLCLTQHDSTLY